MEKIRLGEHHQHETEYNKADIYEHQPVTSKLEAHPVQQDTLENIKLRIEEEALPREEFLGKHENFEQDEDEQTLLVSNDLRKRALSDTLRTGRRHLSKSEKQYSKFIHQPSVDKLSEFGSQTIARPAGLIGAGLGALGGSIILLYVARHYGFEYRFYAFGILIIAGYTAGVIVEQLCNLLKRLRP